jgi:hypothetical protein
MKTPQSMNEQERVVPRIGTGTARRDHSYEQGRIDENTLERLIARSEAITETLRHILYFSVPLPKNVRK